MIIREIIEPLTLKCGAFFERSGSKLRSKARGAELRRGSNPLRRAKKGHPIRGGPFWHISAEVRDSNYVRTCQGHVHEPVRTLANTIIPFRVSCKRKGMQANPLRRARHSGLCIVRGVRWSGSLTGYTRWRFFDRRKSDSASPSTPDRGRRSRRRPAYSPAPARKPRWQPRWRCSRSPPPD